MPERILSIDLDAIREAIEVNMGADCGFYNCFDVIKMPSGGAIQWTVGDKMVPELFGVIFSFNHWRKYWKTPFGTSGGKKPPDCSSGDGRIGVGRPDSGMPGGPCKSCPYAQFGPNNEHPPCKSGASVYMFLAGRKTPVVLELAVTSVPPFDDFLRSLTNDATPFYKVATRVTLVKTRSREQIEYSVAVFNRVYELVAEDQVIAKRLFEDAKRLLAPAPTVVAPARLVLPVTEGEVLTDACRPIGRQSGNS